MVSAINNSSNPYNSYYDVLFRQPYRNNTTNTSAILSGYQNNNNTVSLNAAKNTQLSSTMRDVRESYSDLKASAQVLTTSNQDSVFKKTDSAAIVSAVQNFADKYNATVETLKDNKAMLNNKLLKNLTSVADNNKDRLADIGITINKDKTLTIDADKLKQAVSGNLSSVKTALGSAGGLASKVAKVAVNTLNQPMAAMVNSNDAASKQAQTAQYQAQLNQYFSNTNTGSFGQLYGIGGLLDTFA